MTVLDAKKYGFDYQTLNRDIAAGGRTVTVNNCLGQRFIGSGQSGKTITLNGVPGNALGAYLDGADIIVNGNAQDATGDTMNAGTIVVHGSTGDAAGYAMRGGAIYVRDDAGYRAGIHMKAYADKLPVLVIGGRCGSFLGEYQAGGLIIVLGIGYGDDIAGNFCGTGMHGGKIFLRCSGLVRKFPEQVNAREASEADLEEVRPYLEKYT
ncbi:MAG TPA: glutamate synthase, partial [Candidatus Egerieisoma faecipullorum]|nr:glutamate synthase [Candidatus Egerieisoma faecipullorum]